MERQRVNLQPAFLLHQSPYRDSSRLLDVFSRDHGRIGLVARGARRPKARLRAVLQPFQPLLLSWSARTDLGTLTGAEIVLGMPQLPSNRIYSAYYMNELLLRLTRRHVAHPGLFDHYADALRDLGGECTESRALRLFEKRLLDELGYGLDLRHTVDGAAVREDGNYEYRLEQGVIQADPMHGAAQVYCGRSLLALASETLEEDLAVRDARRLLSAALDQHLGPRPLEVRRVARAMRRALR
ncbi:MAG: DNA repair protein RecO [Gammaproteobacteria bacterium]|nr:DNA repair protein RecO [Gammaproteobacteria bacterium]